MRFGPWSPLAALAVSALLCPVPPLRGDDQPAPAPAGAGAIGEDGAAPAQPRKDKPRKKARTKDQDQLPGPTRQAPYPATPGTRISVAPGAQYRAGALHRWLFGRHYRRTWATPIEVPVLDLATYAGGLKVKKKGGGKQTLSVTFEAADGRLFKFRSIDKEPAKALPKELRGAAAVSVARDQTSADYPGAVLVVDGLSAAAGIPHVEHTIVVMPDDPALGELKDEMAGQMGTLEVVPHEDTPLPPGFEGVTKVIESDELFERIEDDAKERVDAAEFLRARLFDMFLSDWDRHEEQWEWIRRGDDDAWHPVPMDRDQAFSHFDGLLLRAANGRVPTFETFTPRYGKVVGLATNSRLIDRRLLGGLELPAYQAAARDLQSVLTNPVIEEAVRRLPDPWFRLDGARFIAVLEGRRDDLPRVAEAFYRLLAGEVDLHGTSADETVEVSADESGALQVVVRNDGGDEPLLQRRFKPGETRDVRFYLKGGNDRVVTHGTARNSIRLRVDGGPGDDVLDDSQGGKTTLYDFEGHNTLIKGPGSSLNENYWVQPTDSRAYPMRDFGGSTSLGPWVKAGADIGLLGGLAITRKDYGFRKVPYSSVQTLRVGYSTTRLGWKAEYIGDFLETSTDRRARLHAMVSDVELIRFYGFGNETGTGGQGPDFFKTDQRLYLFAPSYRLGLKTLGVWLGAVAKFEDTLPNAGRFLDTVRPYGIEDFGEVGPQVTFLVDTRDVAAAPRRGLFLSTTGTYYPRVWNVDSAFGVAQGEMSTYLSPGPLTLALRAGGRKVFGDRYPFFEASFIGGPETVRGLHRNRYAGDASVFGNAELRLGLGHVNLVVPVLVGVFGFGDVGRVYVKGQSSDLWHTGIGGGLSLAFVRPENTLSVSVAWPGMWQNGRLSRVPDEDGPRFYLTGGFTF